MKLNENGKEGRLCVFSLLRTLVKSKHSVNSKTHNLAHEFVLHTDRYLSFEHCFVLPPVSSIYSLFHISFPLFVCLFVCCTVVFFSPQEREREREDEGATATKIYVEFIFIAPNFASKCMTLCKEYKYYILLNDSMTWFFILSFSECVILMLILILVDAVAVTVAFFSSFFAIDAHFSFFLRCVSVLVSLLDFSCDFSITSK